jgi:3'-phosphoadenosine 5'-phosphosulfate sulfotransferase (PAPS reductase)/FAD synthetase
MPYDPEIDDMLGIPPPRFVIFSSYGNDSLALIQWAHEQELTGVRVVYSDTQWAAPWWEVRVRQMEGWVKRLGYWPHRTSSIGFKALAKEKKAFPTQRYQWCSYILKIQPCERWLDEYDPACVCVCLVGVRREESQDRADFPRFLVKSGNHGGRVMIAPFADSTAADRDALLARAGVDPLPHRSMECSPCINSNKADLQALTPDVIDAVEAFETEMTEEFGLTNNGKRRTLFRPHRHMGAVGIREVVKWGHAKYGKYRVVEDLPPEKDELNCNNGFCAN